MIDQLSRNKSIDSLDEDDIAPDLETRIAILNKKMYADGIELPSEVVEYFLEKHTIIKKGATRITSLNNTYTRKLEFQVILFTEL